MKKFSEVQAPITAPPSQYINASEDGGGVLLKPHEVRSKRKPMWVYLSERERAAVARKAIESGETMSEWIRNAVRKAAKC